MYIASYTGDLKAFTVFLLIGDLTGHNAIMFGENTTPHYVPRDFHVERAQPCVARP